MKEHSVCLFFSVSGLQLGTCIAFHVIIGDLGPALISKWLSWEVCTLNYKYILQVHIDTSIANIGLVSISSN